MKNEKNNSMPEPESGIYPVPGNKTKVGKWSDLSSSPSQGFLNRRTFAFQPLGCKIPLMTMEAETEAKLARLVGIDDRPHPACEETRRRIHVVADQVFCTGWDPEMPSMPFSAVQLAQTTAYIDAFPKYLGYDYLPVLRRDAALLIPLSVEYAYDVNEMLRSFVIWRRNFRFLHNRLLIVGLFLLFFSNTLKQNFYRQFRYDLVVDAIMSQLPEADIRRDVNSIIQRGLG